MARRSKKPTGAEEKSAAAERKGTAGLPTGAPRSEGRPGGWALLWPTKRPTRLALLAILSVAFLLRFYKLAEILPLAWDEAIYLRWAEIIDHQGQWFISLLDGKPPLSYWVIAVVRKTIGGDPLLGARGVSAGLGVLSTLGLFAIGRSLSGERAGLATSALYSCFPYAVVLDRFAYTEAFVNFFGIAFVLASLECFRGPSTWKGGLAPGLTLGLGLFAKQTMLLFAFVPLLAGLWLGRSTFRTLWPRLGVMYGIGLIFFVAWQLATPNAPTHETHDPVIHNRAFFVDPGEFLRSPLAAAPANIEKLSAYTQDHVTSFPALLGLVSLVYLVWRRSAGATFLALISAVPLLIHVLLLVKIFPSRYAFPYFWPWLVIMGMAAAAFADEPTWAAKKRFPAPLMIGVLTALAAGPFLARSLTVLNNPRENLDLAEVLGSRSDYGTRETVDFLLAEAQKGPLVLLTDPIWGPPADTMFAYLNKRRGIRVYEAWWTQVSASNPILPDKPAEVLKSHYEREKAGVVDFSRVDRVYYVTDTFRTPRSVVLARQPDARLEAFFQKPGSDYAVQVYRLK